MLQRLLVLGAAWGGVFAMTASAALPWMKIPSGTEAGELIWLTPKASYGFRAAALLFALALLATRFSRGAWDDRSRVLACFSVAALVFFPYFSMVWDPRIAAQASWLQMQHENLTWLGGDVCTGAEFGNSPLKISQYPVDPPRRLTVFRVPMTPFWELELSNLTDLMDWLGFTEAFCQFANKGWFAALFGSASVLTAVCVVDSKLRRTRIIRSIRLLVLISLGGAVFAWGLPFAAGAKVAKAEEHVRAGEYEEALASLDQAAGLMPVLRHDSSYVAQRGRLGWLLGLETPEAHLYHATRLEAEGRFLEAEASYQRALTEDVPGGAPRREACRALLRDAIHALNSGRTDAAARQLQEVLVLEPTNLKANTVLQLTCLRAGRYDEIQPLVDRLKQIYASFQSPTKEAVLAAGHANCLAAALDANDPAAAWQAYRKTLKP